jgi:hypothetical protein
VATAAMLTPLGLVRTELVTLPVVALIGVFALNYDLYAFFFRQRGLFFASACVPLHLLYYLYSGMSYVYVWSSHRPGRATSHRDGPVVESGGDSSQNRQRSNVFPAQEL